MNEYGGCLHFEGLISQFRNGQGEYYRTYQECKVDVDSGRSAIQYILETGFYRRIWLPVYNCPLVVQRIERANKDIEIVWYNLNKDFSPAIEESNLQENDLFLWVNYCGVMPQSLIDYVADMQNRTKADVIIDNIPAYFSEPRMNVFNIYSCRKFLGVPDGGHIIKDAIKKQKLESYSTAENYLYLLRAAESGSNSVYKNYLQSESRFSDSNTAYGMPYLTYLFLQNLDYEQIKKKRKNNFDVLHRALSQSNRMCFDSNTTTPSVYPYLTNDIYLRQALLNNRVYVSRFWKHVLTNEKSNDFERDLAEYLIPLPIDQRYSTLDMEYLAQLVLDLEK